MNSYDPIEWKNSFMEDLLSFLNVWLINHILKIDIHLGTFIVSKLK